MGNNESNDPRGSTMSAKNLSRLASENTTRLDVEAPSFHPKLFRSDTTAAQAGSPPSRRLSHNEQPSGKGDPDTSANSSANCSFPLSESGLPTNFDTSGDFAPAQLSHFFPLPPTKLDATPAASNSPSNASLHKTSMTSLNESMGQASLQETLDALWAPPKHVPVRISAPVSPTVKTDEPLIDFSSEPMPTMSSFVTCSTPTALLSSGETSFEVKSSGGVPSAYQSGDSSAFDIGIKTGHGEPIGGVQMCREETLTQLVASHPELNLGLDSLPKNDDAAQLNSVRQSGSVGSVSVAEEDEPIQLPPFTYADAANIATKYPELAARVLNEPLATPVKANVMLEPDEEAEVSFTPHEAPMKVDPTPAMPEHTPDCPNWALAPDDPEPEYYERRPPRRREYDRRQSSDFAQNQNEFDDRWQYGGDRSRRNDSPRYSGHGRDEQDNYNNARNGPSRRGRSQEPSYSANDRNYDVPPHLRAHDSYDQSYRLPSRPSVPRIDSLNAGAPVEDSAPAVDDWNRPHDPWAPAAEQPTEAHQTPAGQGSNSEVVDEWAPKHDPWGAPAEQSTTEARNVAHSQAPPSQSSFRPPIVPETDERDFHRSAPRSEGRVATPANEWVASHDPWAVGDENKGHQSQMLEPNNKRESNVRGGGSPFRDRMNDNENQNNRSINEGHFSANVLDVRAPSQSNVAALAASHAGEMYDRRGPENTRSSNQEDELPVEFNYFMHSETVDWTSPGPTKPTQNSFSPSQNLGTPPTRTINISAPAPRATDYFDYNQQPSDSFDRPAAREDNFKAEVPDSNSFVLGSMKTDRYESYADEGFKGRERSTSQWGPSDRERDDGGRGRGRDSASPGYGGSPAYGRGRRGDDYDNGSPYASRGKPLPSQGEQYNNSRGGYDNNSRGGNGSMGPMPPKYSGPPRRTSYGAVNFVLPPLDEY
ncbi:hypothetical protein FB451DRAFT_1548490 [Mycena latifolia]|nr:hypothetical protein FB451DRAFT_1548490 [Mycena latifolia]